MAGDSKGRNPSYSMFGLNQPETTGQPSDSPTVGSPQPEYAPAPPPKGFSGGKFLFLLVLALLILSVVNLYLVLRVDKAMSTHTDQLNLLTRRLDSSDERYAQLRGQFQVTSEKLGLTEQELARARAVAANVQRQQQAAVQELNAAIARKASAEDMNKLQTDATARFGSLSTDLAGTRKDLEATKEALTGAKGELTGAIARTHDELVALAHKGDRDYFEFNLARRKARQKVGTVMVELAKTDTKRNVYTVRLYFDDKQTDRRDKALFEPVYFYVQGASSALEMVVNKLGKDSVAGYVSTPKGFFPNTPTVVAARPGS